MSLVSNSYTTACVKTIVKTILFVLSKPDFLKLVEYNAELKKEIENVVEERNLYNKRFI